MPTDVVVIAYADDLALVVTARKHRVLQNKTNTAIEKVIEWLSERSLQLAEEKTEAIMLTDRRKVQKLKIKVGETTITPKKCIKYLGLWIDKLLKFDQHIYQTTKKAEIYTTTVTKSRRPASQ